MVRRNVKLTTLQRRFAKEYIVDLNGTQAAIRAGYSAKTARHQASYLLAHPNISRLIEEAQAERNERLDIDADYVLQRLRDIDGMQLSDIMDDVGNLKPLSKWPQVWQQSVSAVDVAEIFEGSGDERVLSGLLKKIKWPDKLQTLALMGKHINVQAFVEKKEVKTDQNITVDGLPPEIMEMIQRHK